MPEFDDKTARCILESTQGFLLVVHSNTSPANRGKWGLPGGRLEPGESALATLRRELAEELFLEIDEFSEVGCYQSQGRTHRVFATSLSTPVERWDGSEIERVQWHSLAEIERLEAAGLLHTGFEAMALRDLLEGRRRRAQGA